jgi:osmotically-inducible protein OsmY
MKSDAEIQQAVLRELKWDSRVKQTDVGVEVDRGTVTLTGTVDTYAARIAAQEAAHGVAGVLDVANDLQVHLPSSLARTDTDVARVIRDALKWDVLIPADRIQTSVTDGWVTLDGQVDTWHQFEAVERAVSRLGGVRGLVNRIKLSVDWVDPAEVQEEIEEALERRAERAARRIQVIVENGTVTLTGTVDSSAEKRAVCGAARFTHGVGAVDDKLVIDPNS